MSKFDKLKKEIKKLHICMNQTKDFPWEVRDQNERVWSSHLTSDGAIKCKEEIEFLLDIKECR